MYRAGKLWFEIGRDVFKELTVGHVTRAEEVTMFWIKGAVAFMYWLAAVSIILSIFDKAGED